NSRRALRAPNDCRINCKTASHSDGDGGTPPAPHCRRTCGRRAAVERGLPKPAARPAGKHTPFCQFLAAVRAHASSLRVKAEPRSLLKEHAKNHSRVFEALTCVHANVLIA